MKRIYIIILAISVFSCSKYDNRFKVKGECTDCTLTIFTTDRGSTDFDVKGVFKKTFRSNTIDVMITPHNGSANIMIYKGNDLCNEMHVEYVPNGGALIAC